MIAFGVFLTATTVQALQIKLENYTGRYITIQACGNAKKVELGAKGTVACVPGLVLEASYPDKDHDLHIKDIHPDDDTGTIAVTRGQPTRSCFIKAIQDGTTTNVSELTCAGMIQLDTYSSTVTIRWF